MKKQLDLFDNEIDKEFVKIKVWRNDLVELHFDDYLVNRLGQIWSVKKNGFLKPQSNKHRGGYCQVSLKNKVIADETKYLLKRNWKIRNKSGAKNFFIHRIVACTFLNNPDKNFFRVVNHIDHNPQNNKLENLEWVTSSENKLLFYNRFKNENQLEIF